MKIFYRTSFAAFLLASTALCGQDQPSQPTTATATDNQQEFAQWPPNSVVQQGFLSKKVASVVTGQQTDQPGYQSQNGAQVQPTYQFQEGVTRQQIYGNPDYPPVNPFGNDYSYGQSSVQYAAPILPIKPYVPYSELSPLNNAYPVAPYNSPQANQVNQEFMQRYSQQDQDYIRSQYGYPHTFIDPNAGKPPLGKPIRYGSSGNIKAGGGRAGVGGKDSNKGKRAPLKTKPLVKTPEAPTYFFPGMVALSNRLWVGSDYLFFVPTNIGVVIEVIADKQIKSDDGKVLLDEMALKKNVETIFQKAGITPQSLSVENAAPLPFFHVLIMLYHVENKVFASIAGRLFEDVKPIRLDLDAPVGTFQAITWEKNDILIASTPQSGDQIGLMVGNIAQTFVNSYHFFAEEELDMTSPDDLRDN